MIRKKNSFLTFLFSLLPGAGQMYMGLMKRGTSLMSIFFLVIFLSAWLNIGPLMLIIPIIWFYSFFDVHNISAMSEEELPALEDEFVIFPDFTKEKIKIIQSKYHNIIAIIFIVIGFTVLWNNFYETISWILPDRVNNIIYRIGYNIPQLAVGLVILLFGIYLIRGKKRELDLIEDNGGNRE